MKNKVALVTGSSKGIGAATIIEFAKNGYDVVINYNSSIDRAKALYNKVTKEYDVNVSMIKCDISKELEVKNMVRDIIDKYGKIDVLVNNAGIAIDSLIEDKTVENFKSILEVNLIGAFLCSRECAKYMVQDGCIINVASTNGINTYYPYSIDYDASKAGLISLTNNLAVEYSPNIRVNAVAPGWVNTEMNKELDKEYIAKEKKKILLNRFAEPNEIAKVIVFLASDNARFINNEVLRIDGGQRC